MEKAKDLVTPLAEVILQNKGLMAATEKLIELAVLEFIDIGNDLDAIDGLRDTFIYLGAKAREERTATGKWRDR
jgi:hypothetical protein